MMPFPCNVNWTVTRYKFPISFSPLIPPVGLWERHGPGTEPLRLCLGAAPTHSQCWDVRWRGSCHPTHGPDPENSLPAVQVSLSHQEPERHGVRLPCGTYQVQQNVFHTTQNDNIDSLFHSAAKLALVITCIMHALANCISNALASTSHKCVCVWGGGAQFSKLLSFFWVSLVRLYWRSLKYTPFHSLAETPMYRTGDDGLGVTGFKQQCTHYCHLYRTTQFAQKLWPH